MKGESQTKRPLDFFDIKKTSEELGISFNAAANAVSILVDLDILKQTENVQRNRVFVYEEYIQILRKDI